MKSRNVLSILTGTIFIVNVINIIGGVFDIPCNAALFSVPVIATGISLCTLYRQSEIIIQFTRIDLFMTIITVGYLLYHFPFSSLWNLSGFSLLVIYWSIRLTNKLNYVLIYYFILISTAILILTGYLQYIGWVSSNSPHFSITGPYRNPTIYAGMLCLLMGILATWIIYPRYHTRYQCLYTISITLLLCAAPLLIITTCRSAWIALIVVICHSTLSYHHQKKRPKAESSGKSIKHWIGGILIISLSAYGLYQIKPASTQGRALIWKVTSQMIKEKPLTGFSPEGFKKDYMHYQASYLKSKGTSQEKYVAGSNHLVYNEPLRMTVEYGITGLLVYIWFIYIAFKAPIRINIASASAHSALLAGIVWGLFSYPNEAFPILAVMLLACLCLTYKDPRILFIRSPFLFSQRVMKTILLLVVSGLSINLFNQYKVHTKFYKIYQASTAKSLGSFIYKCSTIENVMQNEATFWMYYCDALNRLKYDRTLQEKIRNWERLYPSPDTYIIKGELAERMGQTYEAERCYWLAHYMHPSRQKARSMLAILYKKQGQMKKALPLAQEVLTEKVKAYGFETYQIHKKLERIFENQLK